jgi:predicted nucleic acid-binding protein
VIIIDTSVIYALVDRADSWHTRVAEWYRATEPDLATTPLVLAEVDQLVAARLGRSAQAAWRRDVTGGAYTIHWWSGAPGDAVTLAERYADLEIDLTDASLAVLAARLETTQIATLDERHFRALHPHNDAEAFRLLPMDG